MALAIAIVANLVTAARGECLIEKKYVNIKIVFFLVE